jgi:hypothetical protein
MPTFNFVRERRRALDATRLTLELAKLLAQCVVAARWSNFLLIKISENSRVLSRVRSIYSSTGETMVQSYFTYLFTTMTRKMVCNREMFITAY